MIAWTRLGLPLTLKKVKTTFREDKKNTIFGLPSCSTMERVLI